MSEDDLMSGEDFFRAAMEPGFPDRVAFQVKRDPDGLTFSHEAVEDITDSFHDFVMARTAGQWKKTGVAPSELHVEVRLSWRGRDLPAKQLPWYELQDTEDGSILDGQQRLWGSRQTPRKGA